MKFESKSSVFIQETLLPKWHLQNVDHFVQALFGKNDQHIKYSVSPIYRGWWGPSNGTAI